MIKLSDRQEKKSKTCPADQLYLFVLKVRQSESVQRLWEERQLCCGRQTDAGAPGTRCGWCCGGCGGGGRLSYLSRRPTPPHVSQGTSTTRHAPTRYPEEGFARKDVKLENVFAYTFPLLPFIPFVYLPALPVSAHTVN